MKNKIIIALLALTALLVVFASCGGGSCEHNYVLDETSVTATCTQAGTGKYVCEFCQAEEVRDVPATSHEIDEDNPEIVKATCQAGGYATYSCKNCDYTEKRHETNPDPTAHVPVEDKVPETCLTDGYIAYNCGVCGNELPGSKKVNKLGHTYERAEADGIAITSPTCEVDGKITYTCTDPTCPLRENDVAYSFVKTMQDFVDAGDNDTALSLAALGHNFEGNIANPATDVIAPTCTTPGYTIFTCKNGCGSTQNGADVPALKHDFERDVPSITYVVTTPSTCCDTGIETAKCQDCGTFSDTLTQIVAVVAHFGGKNGPKYDEVTYHQATCDAGSYWDVKCNLDPDCVQTSTRTGAETTDYVEALGHDWILDTAVLTADKPTCKTEGHWMYKCSREAKCNAEHKTEEQLIALGQKPNDGHDAPLTGDDVKHSYTTGVYVKEPTCVSRGIYACSICQRQDVESYEDDVKYDYHDKNNIDYSVVIKVVGSTCYSEGYTIYGCNNDDDCPYEEKGNYQPKLSHTFAPVTDNGVLVCTDINCQETYINVTTVIKDELNDKFCLCGKCDENNITCGGSIIGTGTKLPEAATALTAGTKFTKTFDANFAKGLIELKGEEGTTYTVVIKNGENVVDTLKIDLTVEGELVYIDLYEATNVTSVEITASTAATVSFYKNITE